MSSREAEFETLVRDHARVMAAAVRRVCGRRHRALVPDVEQEVFLALWKRLGGGKEIEYPVSYLYKMALTTALRVVKQREAQPMALVDEERLHQLEAPVAPTATPELQPSERRQLVRELLASLEVDESRALRAYLAGFGHLDVARLFGWTESQARHRIYRSLGRLRERVRVLKGETP